MEGEAFKETRFRNLIFTILETIGVGFFLDILVDRIIRLDVIVW